LFALLGTTFGGNGTSTFNLPNLQGRVPLCVGSGAGLPTYDWGQQGGAASVTLVSSNLPPHTHTIAQPVSNANGTASSPVGACPAVLATTLSGTQRGETAATNGYAAGPVAGQTAVSFQSGPAGSGLPVSTEPPYLAMYFIIALQGIFPSRN
jgi:microcystin-dependent protein